MKSCAVSEQKYDAYSEVDECGVTEQSRDGVVGTMTVGWTTGGSNRGRGKRFFSFLNRPDRLWGPHSLLFNGYRSSLPGVKRPGPEVNHSSPSTAEIKNEYAHISTPHIQGIHKRMVRFQK
jgi:hypothetical protein